MSIKLSLAQRVEGPIDEVAEFVMDPANDLRWIEGVRAVRITAGDGVALGSRIERDMHVSRREFTLAADVALHDPPHARELHIDGEPGPLVLSYALEPLDDGATLVRLGIRGEAGGGIKGYAIRRILEKGVASSLRRLSDIWDAPRSG